MDNNRNNADLITAQSSRNNDFRESQDNIDSYNDFINQQNEYY
jgi:hypothetical protein